MPEIGEFELTEEHAERVDNVRDEIQPDEEHHMEVMHDAWEIRDVCLDDEGVLMEGEVIDVERPWAGHEHYRCSCGWESDYFSDAEEHLRQVRDMNEEDDENEDR